MEIKRIFWKFYIQFHWFLNVFRKKGAGLGDCVPDFTLSDLHGSPVTLSRCFPGKAVVLWMTNLCSTCEERIGFLQEVYAFLRDKVEILAVSTLGKDRNRPEQILKTHRMDFPLLLDPEDWIGRVLGFEHPGGACPLHNLLILDRFGRVRLRHHLSAISDEKFLETLRQLFPTFAKGLKREPSSTRGG